MTIDMSQFYEVFFDEAEELLAEAERLLLGINIDNPDDEELNAIFRAAHSIKGGAATFGFMDMTEITHVLENLLDKIRKHEMELTSEHVDAFLAAKDVLKMELDGHRLGSEVDQSQVADVKMILKSLSEAGGVVISPTPGVVATLSPAVIVPQIVAPADGLTRFNIALPVITDKDESNLREELGLLGEVTSTKQANGRYVISLITDSSQADIVSICSFILDPDDLVITLASSTAQPTPVAEVQIEAAPVSSIPSVNQAKDAKSTVAIELLALDQVPPKTDELKAVVEPEHNVASIADNVPASGAEVTFIVKVPVAFVPIQAPVPLTV